jgi:hypothetical protein
MDAVIQPNIVAKTAVFLLINKLMDRVLIAPKNKITLNFTHFVHVYYIYSKYIITLYILDMGDFYRVCATNPVLPDMKIRSLKLSKGK